MRETNHLLNLYIYGVLFPNGIGEGLPTIRPETALYGTDRRDVWVGLKPIERLPASRGRRSRV